MFRIKFYENNTNQNTPFFIMSITYSIIVIFLIFFSKNLSRRHYHRVLFMAIFPILIISNFITFEIRLDFVEYQRWFLRSGVNYGTLDFRPDLWTFDLIFEVFRFFSLDFVSVKFVLQSLVVYLFCAASLKTDDKSSYWIVIAPLLPLFVGWYIRQGLAMGLFTYLWASHEKHFSFNKIVPPLIHVSALFSLLRAQHILLLVPIILLGVIFVPEITMYFTRLRLGYFGDLQLKVPSLLFVLAIMEILFLYFWRRENYLSSLYGLFIISACAFSFIGIGNEFWNRAYFALFPLRLIVVTNLVRCFTIESRVIVRLAYIVYLLFNINVSIESQVFAFSYD